MSRSLSNLQANLTLGATLRNTIEGSVVFSGAQSITWKHGDTTALSSGTGANKADMIYLFPGRTLTSGNSENIDLYDLGSLDVGAGAGKDGAGLAWVAAKLTGIVIVNDPASEGNLLIGGEGSGAAFNSIFNGDDEAVFGPLAPGDPFFALNRSASAWAIADTTNHLLKIAASGGDATYDLLLMARSA